MFTTAESTVCWMVLEMLDRVMSKKHDSFPESDWGPEAIDSMIKQIRGFSIRKNLTMGELIDPTPKEVICKVILEEKLFQTWTSGRTVLMGDGKRGRIEILRPLKMLSPYWILTISLFLISYDDE